jgi:hypothetical protein
VTPTDEDGLSHVLFVHGKYDAEWHLTVIGGIGSVDAARGAVEVNLAAKHFDEITFQRSTRRFVNSRSVEVVARIKSHGLTRDGAITRPAS